MIELTGDNAYFIPPKNRYGLSKKETFDLTEKDFTITVKVKVDWDSMILGTATHEGGIVAKNGRHCGLSAIKTGENQCYIKAQFWTWSSREVGVEFHDTWIDVKQKKDWMTIAMVHDKSKKIVTCYVDGQESKISYSGEIIDYRDSWIWVGCNNSLDSCSPEHRGFLYGSIAHISIFESALSKSDIEKTYGVKETDEINFDLKPCGVYTFNPIWTTPYKVMDITNNGNSMILFDKKWMASETQI
tara:strand:+ start:2925 stop:3656 length:732 start_codon:yes stop_codon:yes gene_type:complete